MAAVIIHLTRLNFRNPVEALTIVTVIITLALGDKNVSIIDSIGVVDKPAIIKPIMPIA